MITRTNILRKAGILKDKTKMPPLKIGDSIARIPIVQGGMGVGISLSGLASAVANEGGIGVIAANAVGMLEPDYYTNGREANKRALRNQIRKAKSLSDGIIGVNLMVAVNDFQDLLQVVIDEKADMVFMGAGLPLKHIPVTALREAGVKVVPIVSSARAVKLIFRYWQKNYETVPDAVVVEGPKAGGHLGFKLSQIDDPEYALDNIVPQVVTEIKNFEKELNREIPVIAGGGVYTGEDIYKLLTLGASGVQMGTRFVATDECDADRQFKEAYLQCTEKDVTIIKSPVGLPGRAIRNTFLEQAAAGKREVFRCPWQCLDSCDADHAGYCISMALNNARKGKLARGFAFAGSNVYRVDAIVPVNALMTDLQTEYFKIVESDTVNIREEFDDALKKLNLLKNQYSEILKKSMKQLKTDIDDMVEIGTAAFTDERKIARIRLENLKNQYTGHFNRVNELKDQLSKYFDISALKLPTPSIGGA
ncbi:MAG: nitronate monooxygenase [bacterium]|nr:nitronate monooxygenase [bacterium]